MTAKTLPLLNSDAVREIVADCLFRDEELAGLEPGKAPEGAIMVQGIVQSMGFHPGRIAGNADKIAALLAELSDEFQKSKGGGMSFLQACMDRHGNQWTGFHQLMEQLILIGIAAGKAEWCVPREFWSVLPGGVPYVVVLDREEAK